MISRVVLQKSVKVSSVRQGRHISCVTLDRSWISDMYNLVLTNTEGEDLHHLTDIVTGWEVHTVNNFGELIYVDSDYNINKLSAIHRPKSILIKYIAPWRPRCIYISPSTGDLLAGMYNSSIRASKIERYNSTLEHIQTLQHDNTGQELYTIPRYIIENRNGDVIVTDYYHRVVVTERGGRYRFTYTGPPSGLRLTPRGICTDAQSHILVCDMESHSVHMIDKDGNFLSLILTQQQGIYLPCSLRYDDKTNLLWVGSLYNNMVTIYRCIHGDPLTGLPKCKDHPIDTLQHFCVSCDVPLCHECTSSENHRGHDCKDVRKILDEVHKKKDGDAVLMCLLLCQFYRINLKEEHWITKYNAVAESLKLKKITNESSFANFEKYIPILKHNNSEIKFSHEIFRHASFLRFAEDLEFVDIFLKWAERESIAEYCRSWIYPPKKDEVFCWLLPQQTEQFIEKLGEDICSHPTMQDTSIRDVVFSKVGIPIQIIMRGDESVKNFIENLKKGRTMMYNASGMIVGCAGSGKTTLLRRLKGTDLAEVQKNTKSTRGIDVQMDVFDVSNTIKVNSSIQNQHFKVTFNETSQLHNVSKHSIEVTDDLKMEEINEPMEGENLASETNDVKQMSEENVNYENGLSETTKAATLSENLVGDGQNVANDSEISGVLRVTKNVSEEPDKKITMVDFAGQCAYYASHQIFLSPRAFFILVLNMEKKFDDQVGEEVCSQKRSIYKGWTHREYLKFWVKSIHQYSSEKAPILLVGTHAEEKTEQEKKLFFREIWKTLEIKDKSLHKHLHVKRRFAVGFHDSESIEEIKLSIAKVVCELDHWGEKLPLSWTMFENFFKEKKNLKILSKGALLAFNEALPEGIKLQTTKDINVMLQFFHDIREILYFDQEFLNKVIILNVQWFADAFKNVITDKNHAEEDLFEFASEWDQFNETGELHDTLLYAIWKMNSNGYIEHKEEIMLYMARLGLLAKMGDKTWYVPCMNKIPFPVKSFSSKPASSILCYIFDVLPAGIFHRLVATCMQIPWKIVKERDRPCIYQTVIVFMFQDHNILLGMTSTEIQLQVFVIEGEVNVSTCHKIKQKIDSILNILSNTFQTNFKFIQGFKCKTTGFCDRNESGVISELEFTNPKVQCSSCPAEKMHIINTKDITKFWKQVRKDESKMSKKKSGNKDLTSTGICGSIAPIEVNARDNSNVNFDKIMKLLHIGIDAVRICFDKFFPKDDLEKTLKNKESDMRRGQFRFQPAQLQILFPAQDGSNTGVSSLSMDITIMYKLLRNYSDIAPPGNGWGKEPKIVHIAESDDIERIRFYRNKYCHDTGNHGDMDDDVFNIIWTDLCQAIMRLSGGVLKRRISEI